jgi:dihydroxyacetone kinase-like predicted kinase
MPPKNNTRKAGMKKIVASCSKRAKKTMNIIQKIRPISSKIYKARTDEYINACTKNYEYKNGKWAPKCDKMAQKLTNSLSKSRKLNSGKSVSKAEETKTFNQLKKDCLKAYSL